MCVSPWLNVLSYISRCFCPPQITRAHYQNGLLASRLDSTPQSPDGSHTRLDTSVSLPPVTPLGTRTPLPLATPPAKHPPSNAQPTPPTNRGALAQTTSSSRRPSQTLPQGTPPSSNHTPLSQTPPSCMSTASCTFNPHPALSCKSQQSPSSAGPDNGPGETTTLLSEQQNSVGPRRPSHTQAHPHPHVHTISHAHTESTIWSL